MFPAAKPDFDLVDESLTENRALSCKLTVEISEKTFSMAVLDPSEQKYLALESFRNLSAYQSGDFNQWIGAIASSSKVLAWHYKSVLVFISNRLYTLIPGPLFHAGKKEQYLAFNLSCDPRTHTTLTDRLSGMDAFTVFAVPQWLKEILNDLFTSCPLHHSVSPLIESVINQFKYRPRDHQTFLNLHTGSFDLLILHDHRVIFCNTFPYKSPEDLLYYLMFVLEQQRLTPDQISLTLMGEIGRHSQIFEHLNTYVQQVDCATRNDAFSYTNPFEEIPGHYFYNLLNAEQCEL